MFDWIIHLADLIVYSFIGMQKGKAASASLHFFIYDSVKIILLLFIVIFLMGIINSYFPVERVKKFLTQNKLFGFEYLMASTFGVVTPFCSCSSVPLFIGFVRGGIPLGVTFSFLITSPLVNEVAIGLFVGLFGLKTTIIYVISGILLGTFSGFILQKLKLESFLTPWAQEVLAIKGNGQILIMEGKQSFRQKLPFIWNDVLKIMRGIVPYVLIGIGIGALMHGYVPEGFFEKYMSKDNLFAVPIATLLAVPLYASASGILPVVQVLVAKGIPIGTAIAFMMGVVGLSFPEAMLLKKVMTLKLIGIFFGVVTLCIIISGYLFNLILS